MAQDFGGKASAELASELSLPSGEWVVANPLPYETSFQLGEDADASNVPFFARGSRPLAATEALQPRSGVFFEPSPPYETKADSAMPSQGGFRVVGARVDALTVAVVVDLDRSAVSAWHQAATVGITHLGVIEVEMPGFSLPDTGAGPGRVPLRIRRVGESRFSFENGDLRGVLDEHPMAGCHLEVTFRATFLATSSLGAALAYVRQIAAGLGRFAEWRLRRVDLAVDVSGWKHQQEDVNALVTRSRARTTQFVKVEEGNEINYDLRTFRRGDKFTGFTVCPGGAIQLRCYDKREELSVQSPEKREMEEHRWQHAGWDGDAPVARVEFQLRSDALTTLQLREPEALQERLDSVWQYLVKEWVRLIVPGTNERKVRCDLDARWRLVTMTQFFHKADPAVRVYIRQGSNAKHALGSLLSFAGAQRVPFALVDRVIDPEAAPSELRSMLAEVLLATVEPMAQALEERQTSLEAAHYVQARCELANARHATAGVLSEPDGEPPAGSG